MMCGQTGRLLVLMLLMPVSLAVDDYFYDEEAEEVESMHVPVFTSRPQKYDVMTGEEVTLPCLMDNAASVIIWGSSSSAGIDVYFTGPIKNTQDPRFTLEKAGSKGNSLVISDLRPSDSGSYTCQVSSNPPVSLKHTVNVKFAPTVTATPENGVVVASQGATTTLVCHADGNPKPTVTWTRKGGLLPGGQNKLEGAKLIIPKVNRIHIGNYACTVDNGIGDPIVKDFRLEVNFAPEIEVPVDTVHTGAGYEAELVCLIHGQPIPEVTWSRVKGIQLDKKHHRRSHDSVRYSLAIDGVLDTDIGQYVCRAKSELGTATAIVELTGRPKEVTVTSAPYGQEKNTYGMTWSVESYSPIEEYKVIYKTIQVNSSSPKHQWEQVTVTAPEKDGVTVMYSHQYTLQGLSPATTYEAMVTAKNKYGWGRKPAKAFRLYTLGARGPAADLKGGEALGSTDPNSAGGRTAAGALVTAAAAVGGLLAML